jgi:5-methylcytosine-specific restriction enzyme A
MTRRACMVNGCPNRFEIDPYAARKPSKCPEHRGGARKRACICGVVDCQRHGPSGRSGWATHTPPANTYAYKGDWPERRARVLERDGYRCQLGYPGICIGKATQVDHIVQPEAGGGSDLANLRAVCQRCHATRTGRQGALAKQRRRQRGE